MALFKNFPALRKPSVSDQILQGHPATHDGQPILPEAGESIILDFIPSGLDSLPMRYHAGVAAIAGKRISLVDLSALVPGGSDDPFAKKSCTIVASFNREGTLYQFETSPVKTGSQWGILRPQLVMKIERRSFYRMLLESSTRFRLEPGERTLNLPARISNLSAGGVLLSTAMPIKPGQRIVLLVPAGKDGIGVEVAADVIDSIAWPDPEASGYFVRARFVTNGSLAIHIDTLEEIVKYIFEQQRLMLKARKLTRA